jgi:hypothetical protein
MELSKRNKRQPAALFYEKFVGEEFIEMIEKSMRKASAYEKYFFFFFQNYTNAICKQLFENCAEHCKNVFDDDWDASVYVHLFDAEQPKIEELLKTEL